MKFATKLSLGCIALLSCALGAAGLLLTGQSFSGSLASTRTALQPQQEKEKYALERIIFQATDSAQFENYILASAAQQYAEQTADAGSSMALWLDGAYALYSRLPAALPRTALKQALTDGENAWQLTRAAGRWYLLLTQPLDLPGVRADMLCAYDVSAVFATRDAQLRAWLAASAALLVLGGGAAVLFSRRVTRPLTALQTASEKIADGEYTQRTQVKTDDEIGALSRSFDAMAAAVEGKINELSKTTQSQQDFIAAFTHEVKTPMTAMLGYADLMRARPDDTETQREAAGYIYHETQRLENLSRSLLALMGLDQAGALELVPCQDAGLLLQTVRSLPQGSTPVPRVISAGCVVQVDRSLWVDMLRNLTLNAPRACQGIEGAAITLRCERRAGQAVFTVTDSGCGIPAADLPRVTEAFYMVDKSRSRKEGGAGLGMSLCAEILRLHGAQWKIESKEGQGTFRHDNLTNKNCPRCGKKLLAVTGKNGKLLVCQDRECGYKETVSRNTNARCPKCHKRMEMLVKGKEETFVCVCGYKEKLSAFQARRAKEGAGVNKKDVQKYMRQQQKESQEPVNNSFAQALAGLKLD